MAQSPPRSRALVPARVSTPLVGSFRFYFADELWEWSAEVAQMHGYPATEMRPTTAQVMSHKHPDDREKMAAALNSVRRTHTAISSRHRIVDVQGHTHEVVVVSQRLNDLAGKVIGNQGFYVDLTSSTLLLNQEERERQQRISAKVTAIVRGRTVIDEVKGMLMIAYHLNDVQAFDLLRWRSQVTNTRLLALAEQLRDDFSAHDCGDLLPPGNDLDHLLLTAHERVIDKLRC